MKPIRILVNGAHGRMGQESVKAIQKDPELTLAGQVDRGEDLTAKIKDSLADVVLDFTTAEAVYANSLAIIKARVHPVIGTSGLMPEQITELQSLCTQQRLGGIIAPNFSLGAILMMKFAHIAARYLPQVEIIEYHHNGKADSPSGTSMRTAQLIAEGRLTSPAPIPQRETIPGARGAAHYGVPIHSIRLPGVMAYQDVIFGEMGETFTLQHRSIQRESLMPGVLLACKQVQHLDHLVYGMENLPHFNL
jgi:4-hydroxy-tetrahydrodipicolinate reductase